MKNLSFLAMGIITIIISGCRLRRDELIIDLPKDETKIVVESYLYPDSLIRISLMHTVPYFEAPTDLPLIMNARVVVSADGQNDTLPYFPPLSPNLFFPFGEYHSKKPLLPNFSTQYILKVEHEGKIVTGATRLLPPVVLDSLKYVFDSKKKASFRMWWRDPNPNQINYYRIIIDKNEPDETPNIELTDQFFPNGTPFVATGFNYDVGDTLIFRFHHISKEYYDFVETYQDAVTANRSPFAEPSRIKSNVTGGIGIFTGMGVTERKIIIQE